MHIKVDQNKTKVDLNSLAICKEIAKIDADKLSQREVITVRVDENLIALFLPPANNILIRVLYFLN